MPAGKEVLRLYLRVEGDSTDDVIVRKRVQGLARVGVPDLATTSAQMSRPSLTLKSRHCR